MKRKIRNRLLGKRDRAMLALRDPEVLKLAARDPDLAVFLASRDLSRAELSRWGRSVMRVLG